MTQETTKPAMGDYTAYVRSLNCKDLNLLIRRQYRAPEPRTTPLPPRPLKPKKDKRKNGVRNRSATIKKLILRDGLNCCWCGRACDANFGPLCDLFPTIEHVIRRVDGGTNAMDNLKVACRKCNNTRHNRK